MQPYWVNRTNYRDLSLKVFGEYFITQFSPVIYYPFAETSGTTIADYSGNGNDATAVGSPNLNISAPYLQGGLLSDAQGAVDFQEGVNQHIAAPLVPFGDEAFTIVLVVDHYYSGSSTKKIYSRYYGGIDVEIRSTTNATGNPKLDCVISHSSGATIIGLPETGFVDDVLYWPLMVSVVVRSGGLCEFFVNNLLMDSATIPDITANSGSSHNIGNAKSPASSNTLDGRLAAFGIVDAALTADDIAKLWEIAAGNQRPTGAIFDPDYTELHNAPITYESGFKRCRTILKNSSYTHTRIGKTALSGRRYWELKIVTGFESNCWAGIAKSSLNSQWGVSSGIGPRVSFRYSNNTPNIDSHTFTNHAGPHSWVYGNGSVLMFAYDADSGKTWFGVDGVWAHGDPATLTNASATNQDLGQAMFPGVRLDTASIVEAYTEPGEFTYSIPDGFLPLEG